MFILWHSTVTRTSAAAENHARLHITLKDMFYA